MGEKYSGWAHSCTGCTGINPEARREGKKSPLPPSHRQSASQMSHLETKESVGWCEIISVKGQGKHFVFLSFLPWREEGCFLRTLQELVLFPTPVDSLNKKKYSSSVCSSLKRIREISCSALRQARFTYSATCLRCLPLSPLHCDKECSNFNASIHSLNKQALCLGCPHCIQYVLSAIVCVCLYSFGVRKAAGFSFVYTPQGCQSNALWIVSQQKLVLCFIHWVWWAIDSPLDKILLISW